MRDDDPVGFVVIEDRMDPSHQVQPVLVDKRLAGQAAKRYLLHVGDSFELGELAQKFPLAEAFVRFDVPGEVQPIDANRVDRSTCEDQSHSRQASHCNEAFAYPRLFTPTKRTKEVASRSTL